jgi:outer membrane protein insertion porin family
VEDRWLLGDRTRLWVDTGVLRRERPFYTSREFDVRVGAERRFGLDHRLIAGYFFQVSEATDVDAFLPPAQRALLEGFGRSAGLTVTWRYDSRDDRFLPKRGTLAETGVLWSSPALGATLRYVQLETRATHHLDAGRFGVFALGGFLGSRQPYGGTEDLPIQYRYFLGGSESVRSFGEDELTPTDAFGTGLGGLTAAEAHLEWRRQIVSIVYGALFVDSGWVSLAPVSFEDAAFGWGFGGGLRVYTPVGPVRLDLAWNPGDLHAADRRFHVHFSFGFGF